jgi:hypothetical protein
MGEKLAPGGHARLAFTMKRRVVPGVPERE